LVNWPISFSPIGLAEPTTYLALELSSSLAEVRKGTPPPDLGESSHRHIQALAQHVVVAAGINNAFDLRLNFGDVSGRGAGAEEYDMVPHELHGLLLITKPQEAATSARCRRWTIPIGEESNLRARQIETECELPCRLRCRFPLLDFLIRKYPNTRHRLKRPVGRPPKSVRRLYASFRYQASTWERERRVVAKVEWHPGELYPRVGFIVTNPGRSAARVVMCYNGRGTAEQWIKEGKNAVKWTRLSWTSFRANTVRLQLHALAYNLANFLRTLALPGEAERWSLTSLREKVVKIGAKVVSHVRYAIFQMAEVAVPRELFGRILARISRLRPPDPAPC
jgi:hypothetical protein